jgi:cytochrome oxidase Cu insertion factor (SCO1/SenC/PrrC family)
MVPRTSRPIAFAFLLLLALGCTAPDPEGAPPDDYFPVPDFALTERSGRTVTSADLQGKVWIASFVFTRCTGPCPQISSSVAKLQDELKQEKDVRLVTFTVDPERDSPDELKQYAAHFGADPERWLFLTGKQDEIYKLLREGFKVAVEQNRGEARQPGSEVTHSTKLVLVDRRGHIRGYFDGRQVDEQGNPVNDLPRLIKAVGRVLREQP